MNKLISDKSTREKAVPFLAEPFDGRTTSGANRIDKFTIISSDTIAIIRCCTPVDTNLVEAHLDLIIATGSSLSVKIGIGKFDSDGITAIDIIDQYNDIDKKHRMITGSDDPIESSGGILFIDGMSILKAIPQRGHADFNEKGFIILLQFDRARTGSDSLTKFAIVCSALMGLK